MRGYHTIKTDNINLPIHFSANSWFNLLQDTGMQFDEFGEKLDEVFSAEKVDELEAVEVFTALVYSAALAYHQEEGIDLPVNRFKLRDLMANISEEDVRGVLNAMNESVKPAKPVGKQ